MCDFLIFILAPVLEFFARLFQADDRPQARAITIGCGVIVVLGFIILASFYLVR